TPALHCSGSARRVRAHCRSAPFRDHRRHQPQRQSADLQELRLRDRRGLGGHCAGADDATRGGEGARPMNSRAVGSMLGEGKNQKAKVPHPSSMYAAAFEIWAAGRHFGLLSFAFCLLPWILRLTLRITSVPPTAFLFPAFPNLHQTFVLWEVLALRQRGIEIALYSIKRPLTKTQQPEGAALQSEVTYLPSTLSAAVLKANLALLARDPRRYLGAVSGVVRGWWEDRAAGRAWQAEQVSADAPDKQRTLRETLEGWFNRSPVLYLLKSLWLVPLAAWLGADLERRGIRRLHAHWASYATTVALVAHWLYDIPFSFSA